MDRNQPLRLPALIRQQINREAHRRAGEFEAGLRDRLSQEARELLATGMPCAEVLDRLANTEPDRGGGE